MKMMRKSKKYIENIFLTPAPAHKNSRWLCQQGQSDLSWITVKLTETGTVDSGCTTTLHLRCFFLTFRHFDSVTPTSRGDTTPLTLSTPQGVNNTCFYVEDYLLQFIIVISKMAVRDKSVKKIMILRYIFCTSHTVHFVFHFFPVWQFTCASK